MKWLFRIAGLNSLIACIHFRPCLFEQDDPELIADCFGESRRIIEERNIFVHIDCHPFAFIKHFHLVISLIISLSLQEQIEYSIWPLSEGSNASQKIAVSKVTLLNILRLRLVNENLSILDLV